MSVPVDPRCLNLLARLSWNRVLSASPHTFKVLLRRGKPSPGSHEKFHGQSCNARRVQKTARRLGRKEIRELRRRKIDGCPIAGALQLIGDKWTMLVVRDLSAGPKRTTELLEDLHPISSRTLMGRLREMEQDELILRNNYGGLPRRGE